jgi:hypothetical protein
MKYTTNLFDISSLDGCLKLAQASADSDPVSHGGTGNFGYELDEKKALEYLSKNRAQIADDVTNIISKSIGEWVN